MGELYVFCLNHLDLTWRRPRYGYAEYDGYTITPYTELQETIIEGGLDFIRAGGNYDLEQTISLREYLARNPDTLPEVRRMIQEGKLHILGGGEAVIDYNLPGGEMLIRNHLYSLGWLQKEFGVRPRFAECCDTFGLSGNLPALFRGLGYEGITRYSRVFKDAKFYWRGISGDILPLGTAGAGKELDSSEFGSLISHDPCISECDICRGKGCPVCDNTGSRFRYKKISHGVEWGLDVIRRIREEGAEGDFCLRLQEEEAMITPEGMEVLRKIADETGLRLHLLGLEELAQTLYADKLEKWRRGEIPEDEIDERQEGNPVTAGCYTTRIKLKQEFRRCEAALSACERLAVGAEMLTGSPYPVKTMEELWRKMAFLYFHDAVPASHSDDACEELKQIGMQVIRQANHLINRSLVRMNGVRRGPEESPYFTVYNPLEFPVKKVRLQGAVAADSSVTGGRIVDGEGNGVQALSLVHSGISRLPGMAAVEFYGDLPAFGYRVFRFVPDEAPREKVCRAIPVKDAVLENAHLKVVFRNYAVSSVTDRRTGAVMAKEGSFDPIVTDDAGNPWGRTAMGVYMDDAVNPEFYLNMIPAHEHTRTMETESFEGGERVTVHVRYSRPDRQLAMLDWRIVYELPDEGEELQVSVRASFDARDLRLSTQVVLPQEPEGEKLEYEIPMGKIVRGKPDYQDVHGYADEWPALHYVCAQLPEVNVVLCNNGTPACKLDGNVIRTALIRTPTQALYAFDIGGAIDPTEHVFRFTLSAASDRNLTPYRRGMALNAYYPTLRGAARQTEGRYLELALPDNAPLLTCKGAEDGRGVIARYLGMEEEEKLVFEYPVRPCSLLEEDTGEEVTEVTLMPFQIFTCRMKEGEKNERNGQNKGGGHRDGRHIQ